MEEKETQHVMSAPTLTFIDMPPVRCRLVIMGCMRIDSTKPLPNWWYRFWYRVLLGWIWERV